MTDQMTDQKPDKKKSSLPRPVVVMALLGPFILFVLLVIIMSMRMWTVSPDTINEVPNALAGKTVPNTPIPLFGEEGILDPASFKGRVTLVNFWGSWCPPCREEHPTLMQIKQDKRFDLIGINYKDSEENAQRFLNAFGNPFAKIGFDPRGRAAIDWGVYGPPETFLIDKNGIIIYKHIGPLTPKNYASTMLPKIEEALKAETP